MRMDPCVTGPVGSPPPDEPAAAWGEVFGDQVVAAAMIDRIVHRADVVTLKGASYRLHNKHAAVLPSARADNLPDDTTD